MARSRARGRSRCMGGLRRRRWGTRRSRDKAPAFAKTLPPPLPPAPRLRRTRKLWRTSQGPKKLRMSAPTKVRLHGASLFGLAVRWRQEIPQDDFGLKNFLTAPEGEDDCGPRRLFAKRAAGSHVRGGAPLCCVRIPDSQEHVAITNSRVPGGTAFYDVSNKVVAVEVGRHKDGSPAVVGIGRRRGLAGAEVCYAPLAVDNDVQAFQGGPPKGYRAMNLLCLLGFHHRHTRKLQGTGAQFLCPIFFGHHDTRPGRVVGVERRRLLTMGGFPSAPQLRRERHPVIIARINKDERRVALTPGNLQLQHLTFGSDPQFGPSGHVARNAGQPGHRSPTRVYSNYGM